VVWGLHQLAAFLKCSHGTTTTTMPTDYNRRNSMKQACKVQWFFFFFFFLFNLSYSNRNNIVGSFVIWTTSVSAHSIHTRQRRQRQLQQQHPHNALPPYLVCSCINKCYNHDPFRAPNRLSHSPRYEHQALHLRGKYTTTNVMWSCSSRFAFGQH